VIIIIIIAVVLTIASGGLASPLWYVVAGTIATAVALTATVVAVALSLYFAAMERSEMAGDLMFMPDVIMTFQDIAKYTGYIALILGIGTVIANGFTTVTKEAIKDQVTGRVLVPAGTTVQLGTAQIMNQVMSWIGQVSNVAMQYMAAEDAKKTAELQSEVEASNRLLEDYTTPASMVAFKEQFESYAFLDLNAKMDKVCYNSTQGLIDMSTTKYYT
jgi:hypothetical protein